MNTETILASTSRTFPAPRGYHGQLIATAKAYKLGGNKHPHFSVTAEISTPSERARGDAQAFGCLHEEILKAWPAIKPVVDMHLSNADDGEPMHGESNGFYWLAGALGGLGERYHGGSDKSPDECLAIFAKLIRLSIAEATPIATAVKYAFASNHVTGNKAAKNKWHERYTAMLPRFAREAKEALSLIQSL